MPFQRTAQCDFCTESFTTKHYADGFPEWVSIGGVTRTENDVINRDDIWLCPGHARKLAVFLSSLEGGK